MSDIPLIPYHQYQKWLVELAPPWLRAPRGRGLLEALGAVLDEHASMAATGVAARYGDRAPGDGLSLIGAERGVSRHPEESEEAYRARVLGAWEYWQWAGTERGVRIALRQLGYDSTITPVRVYDTARWAEFDVYLYAATRSYDGTEAEQRRIIATINRAKAAHTKVKSIQYVPAGRLTWDPPNLTWGALGATWGEPPIYVYPAWDLPTLTWDPSGVTWEEPQ